MPYNISVVLVLHPKNTPWVGNDNIGQVTTKQNKKIHYDAFFISLRGGDVVVFRRPGKFVQKSIMWRIRKDIKLSFEPFLAGFFSSVLRGISSMLCKLTKSRLRAGP